MNILSNPTLFFQPAPSSIYAVNPSIGSVPFPLYNNLPSPLSRASYTPSFLRSALGEEEEEEEVPYGEEEQLENVTMPLPIPQNIQAHTQPYCFTTWQGESVCQLERPINCALDENGILHCDTGLEERLQQLPQLQSSPVDRLKNQLVQLLVQAGDEGVPLDRLSQVRTGIFDLIPRNIYYAPHTRPSDPFTFTTDNLIDLLTQIDFHDLDNLQPLIDLRDALVSALEFYR